MQDQVLHKPRHSEEFQKARQQSNTRQGSLCSAYFLAPWFTLAAIMCWEQPEKNCRRCKSQHQLLVLINAYSCVKLSARFDQISLTELNILPIQPALWIGWTSEVESSVFEQLSSFIKSRPVVNTQSLSRPWQPWFVCFGVSEINLDPTARWLLAAAQKEPVRKNNVFVHHFLQQQTTVKIICKKRNTDWHGVRCNHVDYEPC